MPALTEDHIEQILIQEFVALGYQYLKSTFGLYRKRGKRQAYLRPRISRFVLETAIRQIISDAVVSDDLIDIFDATGLKKSDISILSDEFPAEVKGLPHRNLVKAKMRIAVKRILRRYGYPPDMEGKATDTVLEQAKLLAVELNE